MTKGKYMNSQHLHEVVNTKLYRNDEGQLRWGGGPSYIGQ